MAGDMRITLIGQAAFGAAVVNALVEAGEQVVAVFCPPDGKGGPDPIKEAAAGHGIEVHQFRPMKSDECFEAFKATEPDCCAMAFVTDIVPERILFHPPKGTINFHPSLLPRHRGPSSINWPIIQGETKTGLTIFWPDAGLDTGPILLQKEVEIGPDDTLGTVYFKKIFPLGVDAMVESIRMVREGNAPRIDQDESQATYESWCKAEHGIIDWGEPASVIYDLVRGCDPSPGAGTTFLGTKLQVYGASLETQPAEAKPGTVVAVTDQGIRVAASGGVLQFTKVRPEGAGKLDAASWAREVELMAGVVLGE